MVQITPLLVYEEPFVVQITPLLVYKEPFVVPPFVYVNAPLMCSAVVHRVRRCCTECAAELSNSLASALTLNEAVRRYYGAPSV